MYVLQGFKGFSLSLIHNNFIAIIVQFTIELQKMMPWHIPFCHVESIIPTL